MMIMMMIMMIEHCPVPRPAGLIGQLIALACSEQDELNAKAKQYPAQDIWAWRATADRAGWALRYARLNVLALRKILKKHDKVLRSHFGQEILLVGGYSIV